MKLNPSCWPDLAKNGLYTSIPFTYIRFSSKFPPLTLNPEDNSLVCLTPKPTEESKPSILELGSAILAASIDGKSSVGELPGSLYSTSKVFKTY